MTAEKDPLQKSNDEIEQKDGEHATTQPSTTPTPPALATTRAEKEEERPPSSPPLPVDDEGLLLHYDVIICGTGSVQSILASALARAGKTVLHCDGNDHYGELETVWTYDYLKELLLNDNNKKYSNNNSNSTAPTTTVLAALQEAAPSSNGHEILLAKDGANQSLQFHSSGTQTVFPVTDFDTEVQTPYGKGRVVERVLPGADKNNKNKQGSLAIALSNWTMADGKSPMVYMRISKVQLEEAMTDLDNMNQNNNSTTKTTTTPEQAMEHHFQTKRRQDITSLRSRLAQQVLEQQSRSLAFDVTPSLLYASGPAVHGFITSNVSEHLEFQTMQAVYWLQQDSKKKKAPTTILERVPCSKGDVFQSSLLPPLDKRRFMKFFQLAMDYATERELMRAEEDEAAITSNTIENNEEGVLSLNERRLNQGRSLARPQNKAISQKDLQTLYDCMEKNMDFETYLSKHAKLSTQLEQLIRHALALEIGGTTGNTLSTQEGMGRLCDHLKALGQYGTTAFLTPLYGSGEMSQFFCRSAAVYGTTYLLRRIPSTVTVTEPNSDESTKQLKVNGVVICTSDEDQTPGGPSSTQDPPKEKHVKASHVVLAQEAKQSAPTQRRLLRRISVLRGSIDPSVSRSVIVIPPRGVGDHPYAIHGLVLDESARVAPHGCCLLHLTTVINQEDMATNTGGDGVDVVLKRALESILESSASTSGNAADEIFYTTFSYDLYEDKEKSDSDKVEGLHVIHRPAMQMVADDSFEQAQRIFKSICGPDEDFLAISLKMQEKLKEHLKDAYRGPNQAEDDTEQMVLESAMEMLS